MILQEPSPETRRRMEAQLQRDTKPEMRLRSALHAAGFRFRVDFPVEGTRSRADLAFPRWRVAVFIDGCFWHGCPIHGSTPRANRDWWRTKIEQNVARDARLTASLHERGWEVVRIWEHEPLEVALARVERLVRRRRNEGSVPQ